jgi:hypothetical protein
MIASLRRLLRGYPRSSSDYRCWLVKAIASSVTAGAPLMRPDWLGIARRRPWSPRERQMSGVKCIYCGKIVPWWDCECPGAAIAKADKDHRPRVVDIGGQTVIVADELTVAANHFNLPRYRP